MPAEADWLELPGIGMPGLTRSLENFHSPCRPDRDRRTPVRIAYGGMSNYNLTFLFYCQWAGKMASVKPNCLVTHCS